MVRDRARASCAPGRRARRRRARWSPAGTSGRAGSIDDRTTPTAMTASRSAATSASGSPSATAIRARDRAFGRDDRRDDARPCRWSAPVYVDVQAGRIADAGEQQRAARCPAGGRSGRRQTSASGRPTIVPDDHHPGEDDPGADHPARPRRGQGRGRPQDGGGQAADDRGHGDQSGGWRRAGARACGHGEPVVPSAFAPGTHPVSRCPDHHIRSHSRGSPLGQDAPHLDGRPDTVGTQARSPGGAPSRHPGPAAHRREDLCRQGPDRGRQPRSRAGGRAVALARCAVGARSRGEGRCHPSERRRAPQVAPDPQGQRRPRRGARRRRRAASPR